MKKRCAIYCRVSSSNLGQDIDRQIHECHRYAEMMGYEIVETGTDNLEDHNDILRIRSMNIHCKFSDRFRCYFHNIIKQNEYVNLDV